MDNLFTPEVINKLIELLSQATDAGSSVLMLWLALPLIQAVLIAGTWIVVIKTLATGVRKLHSNHTAHTVKLRELDNVPKQYDLQGIILNKGIENDLISLLKEQITGSYLNATNLDEIRKKLRTGRSKD